MKYLPTKLIDELREKYNLVRNMKSTELIIKSKNRIKKSIEKSAQIHSYRIENPDIKVPFCVSRNCNRKDIRTGIRNIENAFNWGIRNFNPYNFDESFIRELAGKITPELYDNQIAQYRDKGISITGATVTPPYPYKLINFELPKFVSSLKEQLKCKDLINRIETATFAHLHLVRLHPFVDGNGRTSRTLQNIILNYYSIPVPIIESGERHVYYQLLDKAISDWDDKKGLGIKNGSSEGERLFYTLIASKINVSLDKLI